LRGSDDDDKYTGRSGAGPVVLITGCSSGIGLLAAQRFARAGFQVFASMRDPARGAALREQARTEGWWLRTPALDVTSDESVARAVSGLLAETGRAYRRAGEQRRLFLPGSRGRDLPG
jgi:NAD(P)-dependent dehydrogenase (short-subunit alcohol dehydrogenase family)